MADGDDKKSGKPHEGEVLPKEETNLEETKRGTALIQAIGEQFKALAETPGVAGLLSGYGTALSLQAQTTQELQRNNHELSMAREKYAAESRRRLEIAGTILLPILALFAVGSLFGLVWMVHEQFITPSNATTVGVVLAALFSWLFSQRKAAAGKT